MKLTIGRKLFFNLLAVIACVLIFSAFCSAELAALKGSLSTYSALLDEMEACKDLQLDVAKMWQFITDASLVKDRGVIENEAKPHYIKATKNIDRLAEMKKNDPESIKKIKEMKNGLLTTFGVGMRMFAAYERDWNEGNKIMDEFDKASEKFIAHIEEAVGAIYAREESSLARLRTDISAILDISIYGGAVLAVFILAVSFLFSRNINGIITALIAESEKISNAVRDGDLAVRGNAAGINFEFRGIIDRMNLAMDSFIRPIRDLSKRIECMSASNIPEKITGEYRGDFNEIKLSMNEFIENTTALMNGMDKMYSEQAAGDFECLLDSSRFSGVYGRMADGINQTVLIHVDNTIKILNVLDAYAIRGDFTPELERFPGKQAVINEKIDGLKANLKNIVHEIKALVTNAVDGNLDHRGRSVDFNGEYRAIVDGINAALDAFMIPVKETSSCLMNMAEGDISSYVYGNYRGDHALLKESLNGSLMAMNTILSKVSTTAARLSGDSEKVSGASGKLSRSASEMAGAVDEIREMTLNLREKTILNAGNARQADKMAAAAKNSAGNGSARMEQMLAAINDIDSSAQSISRIIKTIDEIAFQTNILALNAAVEAARAGRHGKGFAVVAQEVRSLALRSAEAAKETAELIEASLARTAAGTKIAAETSSSLNEIVSNVLSVTDLVKDISSASEEQSSSIENIRAKLELVDKATAGNANEAVATAETSEELAASSRELNDMIGRFKLRNNERDELTQSEKLNCWEFKKCGRELNGARSADLGVCPAAIDSAADGFNGGIKGGRACWAVAGTLCDGKRQGSFAVKMANCTQCDFYRTVAEEEGEFFTDTSTLMTISRSLVETQISNVC